MKTKTSFAIRNAQNALQLAGALLANTELEPYMLADAQAYAEDAARCIAAAAQCEFPEQPEPAA